MTRITGTIEIDFGTNVAITDEQFEEFKKQLNGIVSQMENQLYDAAHESGFEVDSVGIISLEYLDKNQ
jgi:hypothetical protein